MKALLINGSPREHGNTCTALMEVADELKLKGIDTELLWVGKQDVRGCIACMKCRQMGKCVFDDIVNKTGERLDEFDALVVGSPVYYATMAGTLKCFMDRLFYAFGAKLAYKPAAAVVCARRGGLTATFDQINKFFTINCMPVVSSQYWNQLHGGAPGEAEQDVEGMQTMRTLADNMAWLLKCIECGKSNGIDRPQREPTQFMNFIR